MEIEAECWKRPPWDAPPVRAVAEAVVALSDLYTVERGVLRRSQGDREHLLAKELYFLASDAPKVTMPLLEAAALDPRFTPPASVVDLGCGVGATTIGFLLAAGLSGQRKITVTGVDREPGVLAAWSRTVRLAASVIGVEVTLRTFAEDALGRTVEPGTGLVLCQTALNERLPGNQAGELDHDPATIDAVRRWTSKAPVLLIEPALRGTTRALQRLRDRLLASDEIDVVAPCPHRAACPMLANPRDWCHESRAVEPTPMVAAVQAITKRRDELALFSYLALAPRIESVAASQRPHRWRLVSDPLGSRGKTERWVCCDDGRLRMVRVLDRERSELNEALASAERGTLVELPVLPASDRIGPEVVVRRSGASDHPRA